MGKKKQSIPSNYKKPEKEKDNIPEELLELEEDLVSANPQIFQGVPEKKKQEILRSISFISVHKSHSGPLPDAETLIQYDSVITNGADRIMKMAENQQNHRINMEGKYVSSQSLQSVIGQVFGFIIAIVAIICGGYLTLNNYPYVGATLLSSTVLGLVSIFVIGKKLQKKDAN